MVGFPHYEISVSKRLDLASQVLVVVVVVLPRVHTARGLCTLGSSWPRPCTIMHQEYITS